MLGDKEFCIEIFTIKTEGFHELPYCKVRFGIVSKANSVCDCSLVTQHPTGLFFSYESTSFKFFPGS